MFRTDNRFFILFASIVVNLALFFAPLPAFAEPNAIRQENLQPAPEVTLIDAAGKAQTLAMYKGKPVILHFWATWCPPCVKELPDLVKLHEVYPDIVILPASLDRSTEVVETFYKSHSIDLPVLLDPRSVTMRAYKIRGLPSSVFINSKGQMVATAEGSVNWQGIEAKDLLDHLK